MKSEFAANRNKNRKSGNTSKRTTSQKKEFDKNISLLKGAVEETGEAWDAILDENKDRDDRFAREFKKLRRVTKASNEDFNPDVVNRMMLRAMLTMVLDVIPIAETAYRKSRKESSAYALNSLLNQARELALDLKLSKDIAGQSEFIQTNLLNPVFISFTQILIQHMYDLKNTIDTEVKSLSTAKKLKSSVDMLGKSLGTFQTEMIVKIAADIEAYLTGTLTTKISKKK